MYTVAERLRLRDALVSVARADERVAGAALTGSAAIRSEDEWSDIDLALGLAPAADQNAVLAVWTALMYTEHGAVHHTDVWSRGTVWLYALHARSSIARGKVWQAEYMISGVRDHVLMLACLRHGVPHSQGRGLHLLPAATTAGVEPTLVRSLEPAELVRAFRASLDVLLAEVALVDADLAVRLAPPLRALTTTA